MKLLSLSVILLALSLNVKSETFLAYEFEPCISYSASLGWNISAKINPPNTCQNWLMQLFIYTNPSGNAVVSNLNPITVAGQNVTFQIPNSLSGILEDGECLYFAVSWACDPQSPIIFLPEPWSENDRFLKCPCPDSQAPKDNCIAQFEYQINTQTFPNQVNTWFFEFDDNEYPDIAAFMPSLTNNYGCQLLPWSPTPPPGATFLPKYEVKDKWTFDDGQNPLVTVNYSNYTHPSFYNNNLLSHAQFTKTFLDPNNNLANGLIRVCHQKTVTLSCGPYFTPISITGAPNQPGTVLYDCEVCQNICTYVPETNGDIIYSEPEIIWSEPENNRPYNSSSTYMDNIMTSPNPASTEISVGFTIAESQLVNVKIIDMTGKTVQSLRFKAAEDYNLQKIQIGDIANGNYILTLEGETGINYKQKITVIK